MSDTQQDEKNSCSAFITFEVFLINVPAVLFILGGGINFKNIRSIGFNRVVKYSTMFRVKLIICWFLVFLNLITIIIGLSDYNLVEPDNIEKFNDD